MRVLRGRIQGISRVKAAAKTELSFLFALIYLPLFYLTLFVIGQELSENEVQETNEVEKDTE